MTLTTRLQLLSRLMHVAVLPLPSMSSSCDTEIRIYGVARRTPCFISEESERNFIKSGIEQSTVKVLANLFDLCVM
jgi:hypothetical protein